MPAVSFEHLFEALAGNHSNSLEYYVGDDIHVKTFQELYADVLELAGGLEVLGIRPGQRVGLWSENDYFWVVLDLACLALGAVSVPFHASITDMNVPEAICTFELAALFTASELHVPDGESVATMPRPSVGESGRVPRPRELAPWEPSSPFTILFTSGTTGIPKALELKVKSVTDFLDTANRLFELRPDDRVIVFMPLSHFGQRSYIYAAIILGFDMTLVPAAGVFAAFRRSRPTLLVAVPFFFDGLYRAFRTATSPEPLRRFLGGAMRLMITGSAPIRREVLEFFARMGFEVYEGYGTTESGLITLNHPGAFRLGSVGQVFPNKEVCIGDGGEVLVRGEFCWADRYLHQPDDVNAEVFGGDGYIHTGDIGHFDADGFLHLTGRRKEMMVFSNGSKAHPSEIESRLQRHDEVLQACVFSAADSVCAVIVPSDGVVSEQVHSIVEGANTLLPDYARIQRYVISPEPFSSDNGLLTASLKLNRPLVARRFGDRLAT